MAKQKTVNCEELMTEPLMPIKLVVDSSFVLSESKRGSRNATLYCVGRDIENREIELKGLERAVDEGKNNTVLVKDLSRPGWHRTQTAILIDRLRENNVISVTKGIDTTDENDDLLIGFKQNFK